MQEMVEERRNADKEQRHDLFSGLLGATDDGEVFSNDELLGGSLTSRSFGILGKRLTRPPREYVYISSCWT